MRSILLFLALSCGLTAGCSTATPPSSPVARVNLHRVHYRYPGWLAWRHYGTYSTATEAEAVTRHLTTLGYLTRVVQETHN